MLLVSIFSLEKKVDKMEHSIGSIIAKLDAVLVKTGVMQEGEATVSSQYSVLYYPGLNILQRA